MPEHRLQPEDRVGLTWDPREDAVTLHLPTDEGEPFRFVLEWDAWGALVAALEDTTGQIAEAREGGPQGRRN